MEGRPPTSDFEAEVEDRYRRADFGARAWSTLHHGSGILSILLSAGATLMATANLSGLDERQAKVTAVLAGAAGTLTAIGAFAGFSRKWRINRKTRTALRSLRRDLRSGGETAALRQRFDEIMVAHDNGIDGLAGPAN